MSIYVARGSRGSGWKQGSLGDEIPPQVAAWPREVSCSGVSRAAGTDGTLCSARHRGQWLEAGQSVGRSPTPGSSLAPEMFPTAACPAVRGPMMLYIARGTGGSGWKQGSLGDEIPPQAAARPHRGFLQWHIPACL
ncbi:hypothetical protein NDU88_000083 [Pleurodeles waltl]|uniref:Uncharacterized protein n=1 Tax=Pleurodeles waltl TaxID=8319 RepID=A0AAV7S3J2_PLEWA|nr:hypothetical protein NDU88_000083 [Pleurodeles waltl]